MDNRKKRELFEEIERSGFFVWLEQQDLLIDFINSFKDLTPTKLERLTVDLRKKISILKTSLFTASGLTVPITMSPLHPLQ